LSHGHGRGCKTAFARLRAFWEWITGDVLADGRLASLQPG
jgi:hypothetical protein